MAFPIPKSHFHFYIRMPPHPIFVCFNKESVFRTSARGISSFDQVMVWCLTTQTITRANVDPDLCPHMAPIGPNSFEYIHCFRLVFAMLPGLVFMQLMSCMCGITVFAYYAMIGCDPVASGAISSYNQVRMSTRDKQLHPWISVGWTSFHIFITGVITSPCWDQR